MSRYLDPKADVVFKKIFEEAAFSKEELASYDQYWDAVSVKKTLLGDARREGFTEGKAEGRAEGADAMIQAVALLKTGKTPAEVATLTGLSAAKVIEIARLFTQQP